MQPLLLLSIFPKAEPVTQAGLEPEEEVEAEDPYRWVSKEVPNIGIVYAPNAKFSEFDKYVGGLGQEWKLEGVPDTDAVCSAVSGMKLFIYFTMLDKMMIRVPFRPFQNQVLRYLRVYPSQLTPNAWGFMKTFEIVMEALG